MFALIMLALYHTLIKSCPSSTAYFRSPASRVHSIRTHHEKRRTVSPRTGVGAVNLQLAVGLVFIVLGVVVLALGFWSRSRELLLCAIWLIVAPIFLSFLALAAVAAGLLAYAAYLLLLVLYLAIVGRGMYIALQAQDTFTRLLAGALSLTFFFYVFVNAERERLAVLYKRKDGHYGLIEPVIGGEYTKKAKSGR